MPSRSASAQIDFSRTPFWVVFLVLAALWHLLMFFVPWDRLVPSIPLPKAPVEVQAINPEQLETMKKQWEKLHQDKPLVLGKDQAPEKDDTPPPDGARYSSDRNRRVEKEQRAARREVLPVPGGGASAAPSRKAESPKQEAAPAQKSRNELSHLGVPLPSASGSPRQESAAGPDAKRARAGADQELLDDILPEGAENLLNTERSKYYSFYSRLYEAVGPIWQSRIREVANRQSRIPPGDYVTYTTLFLDSEGRLVEIRLEKSSGVTEFDEAALQSWKRIGRFPNPPRDLLGRDGVVEIPFSFTVRLSNDFRFFYPQPRRLPAR